MIKKIQAIYQANKNATNEELAKLLQTETGLSMKECREWVKAWVMHA